MASISTLNESFGSNVSTDNPRAGYYTTSSGYSTNASHPGDPSIASHIRHDLHAAERAIRHEASLFDRGIFRNTLLPSLGLHVPLSLAAYAVGRFTDRADAKDWLWPSAQVANAWWCAVGRRLVNGDALTSIYHGLSRPETLLLTGVTLWGGRLFYRIARRSIVRGRDDPKYEAAKKEDPEGFWNKILFTVFLPEALFQAVIALPFSAPFRYGVGMRLSGYHVGLQNLAVGLFAAGFGLEVIADYQLDEFKAKAGNAGRMCRDGVWSLVRHPNYLGDTLVHLSFPLLLYASDMLAPIEALGPIANYIFLRFFGGDKENERSQFRRYSESNPAKLAAFQEYQRQKNAFWPDLDFLTNKWTWIVAGFGVAGAATEAAINGAFF